MKYFYSFPVVRGMQANRDYYIAMVPLRMLDRLFPSDDEYIEPEYRAQRKINNTRIPEIAKYVTNNRDSYVFSALAASIDGEFSFESSNKEGDIGYLHVSMDSRFLINDGQHRKAALLNAIAEDQTLLDETISIVFYADQGLAKSQQMFTDLNKHAVKTSNSIAELYDSRDELAVITRNVISDIPFLNEYVDKERDMLGKFSSKLFTLNNIYTANKRIVSRKMKDNTELLLKEFWGSVVNNMEPWIELDSKQLTKIDLRENYIASQAVIVQALGRSGAYFYTQDNIELQSKISYLRKINWKRSNPIWKARVIRANGRMITSEQAILLASNVIKKALHIELTPEESRKEEEFNLLQNIQLK